jgi:cellulose synthase/poly-beta-1,6-N-acetylglucosamine synthase-like glycosyltransferase
LTAVPHLVGRLRAASIASIESEQRNHRPGVERPPRSSGDFLLSGLSVPFVGRTVFLVGAAALFFGDFFNSMAPQQPVRSALVLSVAIIWVANPLARWLLLLRMKRPSTATATAAAGWRAGVATTFVPGSESIPMLAPTLSALVNLRYPHETWLLDEGDDPEAKALCARLGVFHFSRRNRPEYQTPTGVFKARSKHGNYNAWLTEVGFDRYDSISAFDPDHIPRPEYLDAVLGYFDDPAIGYVQAPQAYYNQGASLVAAAAAEETYDFNSTIQMASYGFGFPIVIGSHNNHRTAALREVGGFAAHDADDLLITVHYRRKGWQGVYVPRILARGMTPVDWRGYLTQQRRWARSVLDLKFRTPGMLTGETPALTRVMNALHGLNYLQPAFVLTAGLWVLLASLATGTVPVVVMAISPLHAALLVAALSLCHFYRQRYFLDPLREGGIHWRTRLLRLAKAPFLVLAVLDLFGRQARSYDITSKVAATGRAPRVLARAFAPIAVLIVAAWAAGASTNTVYPLACHVGGAAALTVCLSLIAADFVPVPAPFDPRWLPDAD